MIFAILTITALAILNSVPLTFLVMLFLGNLGVHVGFLALLPGAMAVYVIKNNIFGFTKSKGK